MPLPIDFPPSPYVGQKYTAPNGNVYAWDGVAWVDGWYDSETQALNPIGALLQQVRTLLQDVDLRSGQYRYSTDSLVTSFNQGMQDMYRVRPDIFLALNFVVPRFDVYDLDKEIGIEDQYIPPLVFYVVGLTQARDDEQTQDQRAAAFLAAFQKQLLSTGA